MAKKKSKPIKASNSKRKRIRKGIPLKRYNTILSTVLKDYKKRGEKYDLKQVRKEVSKLYPAYKDIAPSRIPKKEIVSSFKSLVKGEVKKPEKDTYTIQATEVPKEYFDVEKEWFELGEGFEGKDIAPNGVLDFNNAFPEIPIVIKTPENEYSSVGLIGNYQGSDLQKFINENLRQEFNNASGFPFFGTPAWGKIKNKPYAFWGIAESKMPKNIPDYTEVTAKKQVEIEERQERSKTEKAKRKQKPTGLKKGEPKKAKPPETKEVPASRQSDINKTIQGLRSDVEKGFISKELYAKLLTDLVSKMNKGGKL